MLNTPVKLSSVRGVRMTEYYQAFVWLEGSAANAPDLSLLDRDRSNLKRTLVKPYKRGQKIYWESHVKDLSKVVKVEIFKTPKRIFEHIKDDAVYSDRCTRDFNASSDAVFLMNLPCDDPLRSAQGNGKPVTREFINGPPGEGLSVSKLVNGPWVSGIGVAIIVSALTAMLAYFGLIG